MNLKNKNLLSFDTEESKLQQSQVRL